MSKRFGPDLGFVSAPPGFARAAWRCDSSRCGSRCTQITQHHRKDVLKHYADAINSLQQNIRSSGEQIPGLYRYVFAGSKGDLEWHWQAYNLRRYYRCNFLCSRSARTSNFENQCVGGERSATAEGGTRNDRHPSTLVVSEPGSSVEALATFRLQRGGLGGVAVGAAIVDGTS